LLPQMLFSGKGWLWYTGFLVILIALAVWLSSKAEKKLGPDAPLPEYYLRCAYDWDGNNIV